MPAVVFSREEVRMYPLVDCVFCVLDVFEMDSSTKL